jgi:hypothetical protein
VDWDKAIERYELPLLRIVGSLFALLVSARLAGSGLMVPRHVWRSILFVLRPAESAVRRLIIIAARTLVCAAPKLRRRFSDAPRQSADYSPSTFPVAPVFQLFDPLKRFDFTLDDGESFSDGSASFGAGEPDDTPVNAEPLHYRLRALRNAIVDLSKQAERLARYNARRDASPDRFMRLSPMRPGLPPGWRERPKHEVDSVLRECHWLVQYLEDTPFRVDTS